MSKDAVLAGRNQQLAHSSAFLLLPPPGLFCCSCAAETKKKKKKKSKSKEGGSGDKKKGAAKYDGPHAAELKRLGKEVGQQAGQLRKLKMESASDDDCKAAEDKCVCSHACFQFVRGGVLG